MGREGEKKKTKNLQGHQTKQAELCEPISINYPKLITKNKPLLVKKLSQNNFTSRWTSCQEMRTAQLTMEGTSPQLSQAQPPLSSFHGL